jgi:pyruvate/2-oxoglutarate/acetoin dehydrogenase E1 component
MTAELGFFAALDAAMAQELRADPTTFVLGTFPPAALVEEFGSARIREMPIAESAMTGMAVGAAGSGMRPIILWSAVNFAFNAFDQIVNQAARIRYMFGGQRDFPIVFRARYLNGTRSAAQHAQTAYALFAHAGGLKIVVPSGPAEAAALLRGAIRDPNPVIFLEPDRLSTHVEAVDLDVVTPLGHARVVRPGEDVTVVALGYMVSLALEAADVLEADGISAEVIDPRSIVPLDIDAIKASVLRTGRLVVVDESMPTCSVASEIITAVVEDVDCLAALRGAPQRVCTAPVPVPFSPPLEDRVLPGADDVVAAVAAATHGPSALAARR